MQASILRLLQRLQRDHGTALIFVSHDLAVVSDIADDVVVMRSGEVVEPAPADVIYDRPQHPYTVKLLGATRHDRSDPASPPRAAETAQPLLTAADVTKDRLVRGSEPAAGKA